jgi:hypothetical protein
LTCVGIYYYFRKGGGKGDGRSDPKIKHEKGKKVITTKYQAVVPEDSIFKIG